MIILNSGHLVPMDQPEASLDLLYRFTHDISFADVTISLDARPDQGAASAAARRAPQRRKFLSFSLLLIGGSLGILLVSFLYSLYRKRHMGYENVPAAGLERVFSLGTPYAPSRSDCIYHEQSPITGV